MSRLKTLYLLFSLILLAKFAGAADYPLPPIDSETGKFQYQEVVNLDSTISKNEIYSKVKEWVAINYKQAKDVIQMDDKEAGKIIVKGNFPITYYMNEAWIYHTLTIEIKDGRYRYTLTDLIFENNQWSSPLEDKKKFWGQQKKLYTQVTENCDKIIASLKSSAMIEKEDDNW